MYPLSCSLLAVRYQKDHRLKGELEVGERFFLVREMERAVKVNQWKPTERPDTSYSFIF